MTKDVAIISWIWHDSTGKKRKKDNSNFKKINFFALKGTINRLKRQLTNWEKIFVNHISHEGLTSRIDIKLLTFNNKTANNPSEKMGKGLEQEFLQRRYTNGQ